MRGIADTDQCIVLEDISWDAYVQFDQMLGEERSVRLKFADQRLEITSPSRQHEFIKSNLGSMIEFYCHRNRLFLQAAGSATLKREGKRGGEPDESYNFTKGCDEAELVVETALTSGGVDKLDFYRGLKLPEVWIWADGKLTVYLFQDGEYRESDHSSFLPDLDIALVGSLADHPYVSEVLVRFEEALDAEQS